ncbi:hypothetical protein BDK51DRAFT_39825, partial [Blyttiomyces helicus]
MIVPDLSGKRAPLSLVQSQPQVLKAAVSTDRSGHPALQLAWLSELLNAEVPSRPEHCLFLLLPTSSIPVCAYAVRKVSPNHQLLVTRSPARSSKALSQTTKEDSPSGACDLLHRAVTPVRNPVIVTVTQNILTRTRKQSWKEMLWSDKKIGLEGQGRSFQQAALDGRGCGSGSLGPDFLNDESNHSPAPVSKGNGTGTIIIDRKGREGSDCSLDGSLWVPTRWKRKRQGGAVPDGRNSERSAASEPPRSPAGRNLGAVSIPRRPNRLPSPLPERDVSSEADASIMTWASASPSGKHLENTTGDAPGNGGGKEPTNRVNQGTKLGANVMGNTAWTNTPGSSVPCEPSLPRQTNSKACEHDDATTGTSHPAIATPPPSPPRLTVTAPSPPPHPTPARRTRLVPILIPLDSFIEPNAAHALGAGGRLLALSPTSIADSNPAP